MTTSWDASSTAISRGSGAGERDFHHGRDRVHRFPPHPAPAMHAFVAVRSEGEDLIRASGMHATILRPWYVLGPGHRWPYLLLPVYWICERIPATRDGARRLGFVTIGQMVSALLSAVETPPRGVRIVDVDGIRHPIPLP